MDFSLNDDQVMLQEQFETAVSRLSTLERVRRHGAGSDAFADDIWAGLAELGMAALLVPERFGGLEMSLLDAALISELLGRYTVPAPFYGPVVAAPIAIAAAGSPAQQAEWLPAIAKGELRIGLALSEALVGVRSGGGVEASGGRLSGTSYFALDIAGAHKILVADRTGGLHLVDREASGLEVTPLITVDVTRSAATLRFDGVLADTLPGADVSLVERLAAALHVAVAADLLGAGTRMMEMAVDYAKVRQQFGRPIGSFQAVKHLCADMAAELEPGRALIWYAAHAQDVGLADASLAAFHAKACLADAARIAARNSTEVHGGIGITDELGLHFWFKRVTFGGQVFGGATRMRELAAVEQGLGGPRPARELAET
jgi:alkylation response protein AidB-like acyl-CoA dehydrogenase